MTSRGSWAATLTTPEITGSNIYGGENTNSTLKRRIQALERQDNKETIRAELIHPGEPEPVQQPGEHLIVLRVVDMGEDDFDAPKAA